MKPTLLRDWEGSDVAGWLLSEKLDGWRAVFDGENFITRQGNVLNAPDWFLDGMPNKALDGELFLGRGEFNGIQGAMAGGWFGLRFMVFDAPSELPFAKRVEILSKLSLPGHCELVPHVPCKSIERMVAFADDVVTNGGEGVVVRDPKAPYQPGRTSGVLRWVPRCPSLNRRKGKPQLAGRVHQLVEPHFSSHQLVV